MLLWLLVASGIILYIVLDTSAEGAYRSIEALAEVPWMLGTALRGAAPLRGRRVRGRHAGPHRRANGRWATTGISAGYPG